MTLPEDLAPAGAPTAGAPADDVMAALDELVTVARENIVAWVGVMERVEQIREQRRGGLRYTEMPGPTHGPSIIDAVSRNQERLTAVAARFRRALARALVGEGLSYAEIARLFGVTRQRVGNLLREGD